MNPKQILDEIERLSAYGQLARNNTYNLPDVVAVLDYVRNPDNAEEAHTVLVDTLRTELRQARGAIGGLTKQNKQLKEALEDAAAIQDQNRKMARLCNLVADLVNCRTFPTWVSKHDGTRLEDYLPMQEILLELKHTRNEEEDYE